MVAAEPIDIFSKHKQKPRSHGAFFISRPNSRYRCLTSNDGASIGGASDGDDASPNAGDASGDVANPGAGGASPNAFGPNRDDGRGPSALLPA
jgi:hypothetical protein